MSTTTDPNDPNLNTVKSNGQNKSYLVDFGVGEFVRPIRDSYVHDACGAVTRMNQKIAETYARDPKFYGSTFCTSCRGHFPVEEFTWDGTDERVGS